MQNKVASTNISTRIIAWQRRSLLRAAPMSPQGSTRTFLRAENEYTGQLLAVDPGRFMKQRRRQQQTSRPEITLVSGRAARAELSAATASGQSVVSSCRMAAARDSADVRCRDRRMTGTPARFVRDRRWGICAWCTEAPENREQRARTTTVGATQTRQKALRGPQMMPPASVGLKVHFGRTVVKDLDTRLVRRNRRSLVPTALESHDLRHCCRTDCAGQGRCLLDGEDVTRTRLLRRVRAIGYCPSGLYLPASLWSRTPGHPRNTAPVPQDGGRA